MAVDGPVRVTSGVAGMTVSGSDAETEERLGSETATWSVPILAKSAAGHDGSEGGGVDEGGGDRDAVYQDDG